MPWPPPLLGGAFLAFASLPRACDECDWSKEVWGGPARGCVPIAPCEWGTHDYRLCRYIAGYLRGAGEGVCGHIQPVPLRPLLCTVKRRSALTNSTVASRRARVYATTDVAMPVAAIY